jgi:two-component system chemotaxis response regulator CheY
MTLTASTPVLLVEDTEITLRILAQMLAQLGFNSVTEASDGYRAWDLLEDAVDQNRPFGIVLCDWNMPGMTGLDLLRKMHGDNRFAGTPFILLTSNTEKEQVMEAIRAGVAHYLAKPFPVEALLKKMREAFDAARKLS